MDSNQSTTQKPEDVVFERVLKRLSAMLSEEDVKKVEELSASDTTGAAVKDFLATKVPNLEQLVQEEAAAYQKEQGSAAGASSQPAVVQPEPLVSPEIPVVPAVPASPDVNQAPAMPDAPAVIPSESTASVASDPSMTPPAPALPENPTQS